MCIDHVDLQTLLDGHFEDIGEGHGDEDENLVRQRRVVEDR
jgi:hypothetical protein